MRRRVVEHRQRMQRIAHVRPEAARVLPFLPGIADLHRGVVRVDDVRSQHHADRQGVQGPEEFGRLQPPAVHRLPRDPHALPLEDPFQAVQRQMVGSLADDHLGHQPRPGQAAGNRFGRLFGHRHVLLGKRQAAFRQLLFAGVFLADMDDDEQRRRPPVELLAGLRRQFHQVLRAAQRRLLGFRKIVDDFLRSIFVGNSPAAVPVAILGGGGRGRRSVRRRRRRSGAVSSSPALRIEQHALLRIELLARAAVDPFQQAGACGALAAPDARGPAATPPATAPPAASAPPGRRAARRDREEAWRPCSCLIDTDRGKIIPAAGEIFSARLAVR